MAASPEKLLLAAPRGYCAGVDRAVQSVEHALELHGAPVYVRKEIVHNKHVVEELRERGAVFVDELDEVPTPAIQNKIAGIAAREGRGIDETTGDYAGGQPTIFDRYLLDNTTGKHWIEMTTTERVASAINTTHLVWDGPAVKANASIQVRWPWSVAISLRLSTSHKPMR
jgi:hypothetical protein